MSFQDQSPQTNQANTYTDAISETIANLLKFTSEAGDAVGNALYELVERSTETVGQIVTPIADNSFIQYATKAPGLNWLVAAIGQVDVDKVQQEVDLLKQTYPLETPEQLANRVISDTAMKAAGVGLLANAVPPLALSLFAVDLTAIAALQSKMIYHIAAIYGFSPTDATRRGEVLAIWGLSTSGASFLKTGLNFVELIPIVGTVVGPTSNAALLYSLGHIARYFYDTKTQANNPAPSSTGIRSIEITSSDSNPTLPDSALTDSSTDSESLN
jgi:uncharacterized protein (DUF697 family)